ncbi:hypothetical protein ZHAS_00017059 [Anopheles sinensis]|uniref:Uncharacterized protein n=1 Tax=Anopheles sinensis TaxID=74873 RepID=A0A084WFQ3_ANOSI|nr:hypothetical protein ZHAS_00017059 [Anopheles sinensis]
MEEKLTSESDFPKSVPFEGWHFQNSTVHARRARDVIESRREVVALAGSKIPTRCLSSAPMLDAKDCTATKNAGTSTIGTTSGRTRRTRSVSAGGVVGGGTLRLAATIPVAGEHRKLRSRTVAPREATKKRPIALRATLEGQYVSRRRWVRLG